MGGFDGWRAKVDDACWGLFGLSLDDLPDVPLADWHEDGMSPARAARLAVKEANE